MYCSECGHKAAGKFCSNCGTALPAIEAIAARQLVEPDFDWRESCDFERIASVPEIRQRIDSAKAAVQGKVSGAEILGIVDAMASPLMGGLSSLTIAKIAQPLAAKIGLKTGKERREFLTLPSGVVLANLAVALASIEHKLASVEFDHERCTIKAVLPADLRAMDAKMTIVIQRAEQGTWIAAAAMVYGQWHDWGKCQKGINRLFDQLRAA